MKNEKPILMSKAMVLATLEGRKSMTRRLRGLDVINDKPGDWEIFGDRLIDTERHIIGHDLCNQNTGKEVRVWCPYGSTGSLLWVRENIFQFAGVFNYEADKSVITNSMLPEGYQYRNDEYRGIIPCIHMPKSAARIWMLITHIELERLHHITESEAKREGAEALTNMVGLKGLPNSMHPNHKTGFCKVWIDINGSESWEKNPWVWVIGYDVLSLTGKDSCARNELKNELKCFT